MAVLLILVILGVVTMAASEAYRKTQDRKGWIRGVEFDYDNGYGWYVVRLTADPDKKEFIVQYSPSDRHFYDIHGYGYYAAELYVKINEHDDEIEI